MDVKSVGSQPLFGLSDTQQMMFAFGDSRRPNIETAKIIENVVLSQITEIIHRLVAVSHMKGYKAVQLESIIFLMRNSPLKIQRLIKYLSAKEVTRKANALAEGEVDDVNKKKTLMNRCKEFIESIDDTGTLLSACDEKYFDEVYLERLLKNDKITRNMDNKRYEEYCRARIVGFRGSYSVKFQSSLEGILNSLDLKVEKIAQEVVSYLAYETLGQLIEMCLILRRDSIMSGDQVSRLVPVRSINTEFPSVHFPVSSNSTTGAGAGSSSDTDLPGHPITPAEMREVVRRLQQTASGGRPLNGRSRSRPAFNMPLIAI